jgi:DNA polymerase-3 subunit delta
VKLSGAAADRFCARPGGGVVGALLFGEDTGLAEARRAALVAAVAGPGGAEEMRVETLAAAALRSDPGALDAALRGAGFFPGARVVLVTEATDAAAGPLLAALAGAARPDAFVVATAGALKAASELRKGFEAATNAAAIACDPARPDRGAVEAALAAAGVGRAEPDAVAALEDLAADLGWGPFLRLVETVALHDSDATGPTTPATVAALAPQDPGAEVDAALAAAAEGRPADLRRLMARLSGRGTEGVTLAIAATRHFRLLHRLAVEAETGSWDAAAQRVRPPLWGARKESAVRGARRLGRAGLEDALAALAEADLAARGGSAGPPGAMVERALMRIALRGA